MSTQVLAAVNPRYFLNRLALAHSTDSMLLDPNSIIGQLFSARPYEMMFETFEDFCEAAVAPAYCWKQRPGDLASFSEDLEKLIEVSYLLYRNRKSIAADQSRTLQLFFSSYSLPEWKRILHDWTRAALSHCSVAEIGEPVEMIPFVRGMEELIKVMAVFIDQTDKTTVREVT